MIPKLLGFVNYCDIQQLLRYWYLFLVNCLPEPVLNFCSFESILSQYLVSFNKDF
ncbi:uncharacterized protein ASCRUDRAFT_78191 [Ascoidea rubescens DSM 1968]|uniref:Uncharacterized protein n=1 Tax=Ascoidea rubescens DSM 1968 TaxID=1344418 RepID=A0A1D2V9E0_9ASCO|nr:hypothetical protein ASCRUDRAFT_78191 [Ascoidea rubescens DSM 1968]ODV58073.1 hypothetical protein ASCRUDRAFT_78191 [Ascoidea rubescens DSM 1968]